MVRNRVLLCAAIVVIASSTSQGAQFYGGKGFIHTNTALIYPPGALELSLFTRGYATTLEEGGLLSHHTTALSANFGFSRRVELGFSQVMLQTLNNTDTGGEEKKAMTPGNTYLRFKIAGYPIGSNIFWGVIPSLRYRIAKFQNVQFEPYYGNAVEAELTLLGSYYQLPLYPDESLSAHINIGYIHHNDSESISQAAQELTFLVSALMPRGRMDWGVELYGSMFLKPASVSVLGREDWLYLTPMGRYKIYKGMHAYFGLDLLLMGRTETSEPKHRDLGDFANYPSFRITGRLTFTPSTAFYAAPSFAKVEAAGAGHRRGGLDWEKGMSYSRQDLFKWAIEERGGEIEVLDLDLEKIRQERKKAEEELQRLKKQIEEKQMKSGGQG